MTSVFSSVRSLMEMFHGKTQEFISEIDNVHMVWLEEIQQEANRMFSRDFNTEPELMPKTPSQKKKSRRKRVSLGRQEESQARRFSKGRRSNLRGSGVKPLDLVAEEEANPDASTSAASRTSRPKRATRKDKQTQPEVADGESQSSCDFSETEEVQVTKQMEEKVSDEIKPDATCGTSQPPPSVPSPEVTVRISAEERLSAEITKEAEVEASTGRAATKIAIAETTRSSRRSSGQCSLNLRHSLAGLRHSMTQESVRRASRRSVLKRKAARKSNSTCSSVTDEDIPMDTVNEEDGEIVVPCIERVTRSAAANSPKLAPPSLFSTECVSSVHCNRKAPDSVEDSPSKRFSPPMKSQSAIKPHMRSFLHTVQKNQMLMMTPNSSGRAGMIKSFIKHTTPLRVDHKTKERHKLEALRKKQEQEEERMRKMEEEKKRKQEELKKKRDERIRRVFEAKVKEEQREVEKKKKIEQKMAQIDEKNEKRLAEEKTKKKLALKRQEELEQKRKLEEEAKKKKIQQVEEEKRQQELAAKKKAEEEEEQARRALELRREQERERQAAAERQRLEKEKALALQRELEKAAREKEMRDLEEKRKALEEKRKLEEQQRLAAKEQALKEREEAKQKEAAAAKQRSVISTPVGKGGGLNVTVDVASSPQSYAITPNGGNKTSKDLNDYGMDQNSDDSTDDESAPRKPIPSWAEGPNLKQLIMKQYFNPPDLDSFFGVIEPPRLEDIFYKNKPRYFKRTSSAVWHSPPSGAK
uniref:Inner centromere protein n=1 Tax=Kryptolebias marmoratus TaxID=37003 RepID=A0A3Q3BE18_KRYMA